MVKVVLGAALLTLLAAPLAAKTVDAGLREAEKRGAELQRVLAEPGAVDPALIARARDAFAAAGAEPCGDAERARTVVLSRTRDGTQTAYLIPLTGREDSLFLGGYYRIVFAADGRPGALTRLGEGCKTLDWSPGGEALDLNVGYVARPGALAPSEIDVLISRLAPFAIGVVTGAYVWPVIGGSIAERVDADPDMGAMPQ